jgi:hypothetical protein
MPVLWWLLAYSPLGPGNSVALGALAATAIIANIASLRIFTYKQPALNKPIFWFR